jgi:hypothetical protein
MANTVINLSDAISQLVTKINIISSHVSDVATLTTTDKSNLVAAINELDAAAITLSSSGTMTNKTIDLANNTLTGTGAQFNTALSDGDFATLTNVVVLTNKTISGASNTLTNISGASIVNDAINSQHYAGTSIDTEHIADLQITTAKIADNSVTEDKMANDAISSAELKSLSTLLIKNSSGTTLKTIHGAGA